MSFTDLAEQIFQRKDLQEEPPTLIDIGASIGINPRWKAIARYCVCVAFDPDDRDFEYTEKKDSGFKRLWMVNKVVVGQARGEKQRFHLTKNPYCSSLLPPRLERLRDFSYAERFEIDRTVEVEAVDLPQVLCDLKVKKFDWIKIDSQGVDLQLFSSLPVEVQNGAVAIEFEPGLIDTYLGEDKLAPVLAHMEGLDYFLVNIKVCEAMRIPARDLDELFPGKYQRKCADLVVPRVPAWTEIAYLHKLRDEAPTREFILAWLFATIFEHHEVAYVYARRGFGLKREPLFQALQAHSAKQLRQRCFQPRQLKSIATATIRKLFRKK